MVLLHLTPTNWTLDLLKHFEFITHKNICFLLSSHDHLSSAEFTELAEAFEPLNQEMDHPIAARCPDPGEQRTSWRDDILHDSPWESFLILTDDGNQWKSGLISWNACKIPLFAGFWSILSINRSVSPIECLFHSSIWWPYRMKLQLLQRWALRKRCMWASWCKGCHVPSNSNIWFVSCSLTIACLMFLFGQKITPQYCRFTEFYWTWWHDSPIWTCLEHDLLCSISRLTSYVHQLTFTFDMHMSISFPVSNRIRYI